MCSNPADRLQKTFWSFSATATTTILILAAVAGVRRRFTSAGGDRRPTMNNCACHRYEEIFGNFLPLCGVCWSIIMNQPLRFLGRSSQDGSLMGSFKHKIWGSPLVRESRDCFFEQQQMFMLRLRVFQLNFPPPFSSCDSYYPRQF